jgi:hypothetical protein
VTMTAATAYGSQRFALAAGPILAVAAATAVMAFGGQLRPHAPRAISVRLRPASLAR